MIQAYNSKDISYRWPDQFLLASFSDILPLYQSIIRTNLNVFGSSQVCIQKSFETICALFKEQFIDSLEGYQTNQLSEGDTKRASLLIPRLKERYGEDWLQALASIFAMLMHFSIKKNDGGLVNLRRPKRIFSTYPNSPAVTRLTADPLLSCLVKDEIPPRCSKTYQADCFVERAFSFRVLDPSMESGQLLIEMALASIRLLRLKCPHPRKAKNLLIASLLKKLCRDCLWGIDRNRLAVNAVETLFCLLGAEYGISDLRPSHLFTGDSLTSYGEEYKSFFDGIVNNPPWGETLSPKTRARLFRQYSCIRHRADTYIAFAELGLKVLKHGGIFGLMLPAQFLGAHNATYLRELFLKNARIDRIILLPHTAFACATVRGLTLIGRAHSTERSDDVNITLYPLTKRINDLHTVVMFNVPRDEVHSYGGKSWWPLLNTANSEPELKGILLREVAKLASGVKLYARGQGVPAQTKETVTKQPFTSSKPVPGTFPAIRGRDVQSFLLNDAGQFIKFGKWLAYAGNHDALRHLPRIFLRELCRRDGMLTAAISRDGFVPLHGVLTVLPKAINIHALLGVLNSKSAAHYVKTHAGSFAKVDFQRLTIYVLKEMPIPPAAINPSDRATFGLGPANAKETEVRTKLIRLTRRLSNGLSSDKKRIEKLRDEIDLTVAEMYKQARGGR